MCSDLLPLPHATGTQVPSDRSDRLVAVVPPPGLPAEYDLDQLYCAAYRRLHGPVLEYAERFVDRDTARDAVDEAMAQIWCRWPLLSPEQREDPYCFRAVRNSVLDEINARRLPHRQLTARSTALAQGRRHT